MDQIAPRVRTIIPHVVRPTGLEDAEELLQDPLAMVARRLHALEARGKMAANTLPNNPSNAATSVIALAILSRRGAAGRLERGRTTRHRATQLDGTISAGSDTPEEKPN